jgi:three-Cys-motif partner protein
VTDLLDQLGDWSQIKHEILDKYGRAYTTIVTQQPIIKKVLYLDAYAGSGFGVDRETGAQLQGSATRALAVVPPFHELQFVEQDPSKATILERTVARDARATVHRGDGVTILTKTLLPRCRWEDYHRALCLLDPYDLPVPFTLIQQIGHMGRGSIDFSTSTAQGPRPTKTSCAASD